MQLKAAQHFLSSTSPINQIAFLLGYLKILNPLKQALILFFTSAQVLSLPQSLIFPTSITLLD